MLQIFFTLIPWLFTHTEQKTGQKKAVNKPLTFDNSPFSM